MAAKNQRADADAKAAAAGKAEVAKAEARLRKRQEEAKAAEAKLGRDRAEVERMRGERLALPGYWEKKEAVASQAGFAVHPLTEARNQAEWRALSNCLRVPHPEWFGQGRDVVEHGRYNRLENRYVTRRTPRYVTCNVVVPSACVTLVITVRM